MINGGEIKDVYIPQLTFPDVEVLLIWKLSPDKVFKTGADCTLCWKKPARFNEAGGTAGILEQIQNF